MEWCELRPCRHPLAHHHFPFAAPTPFLNFASGGQAHRGAMWCQSQSFALNSGLVWRACRRGRMRIFRGRCSRKGTPANSDLRPASRIRYTHSWRRAKNGSNLASLATGHVIANGTPVRFYDADLIVRQEALWWDIDGWYWPRWAFSLSRASLSVTPPTFEMRWHGDDSGASMQKNKSESTTVACLQTTRHLLTALSTFH